MKKKYTKVLIACSGGPDSMTLLVMFKDKYEVCVAHVNYHKRDSANRDEKIVEEYCQKNNLKFFKKDYLEEKGGNFQNKARVFRYKFFADIVKKENLDCVFVAHHRDDLIETYLLQEKRRADVSYYGLNKEVIIQGVKVVRPLLKYDKKQLENYCLKNDIEYGIDESNLTDHYTRNKIRHTIVEKMSKQEKKEIINKINDLNKKQKEDIKRAKEYLNNRERIKIEDFLKYDDLIRLLRMFVGYNISLKQANELLKAIKNGRNFEVLIKDKYLCKEYDYLEVYRKEKDYLYKLDKLTYFNSEHFCLKKSGDDKHGVTVSESDFPLTIRNYQEGDCILLRYGTKKINRFFIDNKISSRQRKMWPIMFNKDGIAILVPEIGADKYHYSKKHDIYMIK